MPEERPSSETILEYLYGLLEPAEATRVRDWLESSEGAAARAEADRAKSLFATAAKMSFPEVKFERPSILADKTVRRKRNSWTAWAVAAAVLIMAAIPFGWHELRERECTRELASIRRQLDVKRSEAHDIQEQNITVVREAEKRLSDAHDQINRQQKEIADSELKLKESLLKKQLSLSVSGPGTIVPGGPNDFHIRAIDGRNQPATATVTARVRDSKKNQVYEQVLGKKNGEFDLRLPPDLALGQSDVVLELDASGDAGAKSELREQLPLALPQLLTHLTTDKPLYRPGETIRFRSLTLDRLSLKPPADELQLDFVVIDPEQVERSVARGPTRLFQNDSLVVGPDNKPIQGIGCGEWVIPNDVPDGEYALSVRELNGRFPTAERRFKVYRYKPEKLLKELEWSGRSYGPGEKVVANSLVRTEAGPVVHQPVRASVTVDGKSIPIDPVPLTDEAGRSAIQFELPSKIERGDAKLNVEFQNGTVRESLSRAIPIALKKLEIEFFPEGGDLVAGTLNRVYFQVHTTLGKPADVQGRIVDRNGREVARASTFKDDLQAGINQGMGRFEFVPEIQQEYHLIVDQPQGVEGEFTLPSARESGVVLTTLDEVNPVPGPLRIRVASVGAERPLLIAAYARGRMLDHRRVVAPANQPAVIELMPEPGFEGITRITVFEERSGQGQRPSLVPVAERLVYRKPSRVLNLSLKADRSTYSPGERVRYKVSAEDEARNPAAGVLYFAAVNESVITMADDKTNRSLPTYFLLTGEVGKPEDLEHADVLLGADAKAGIALDLLLGVQGWRRFKEELPSKPNESVADSDRILLAASVAPADRANGEALGRASLRMADEIRLALEAEQSKIADAEAAFKRLKTDTAAVDAEKRVNEEISALTARYNSAESDRASLEALWRQSLRWLLPVLCGLGLGVALVSATLGILRGWNWRIPAAASLTLAIGAAVLLAVNMLEPVGQAPADLSLADNAPSVEAKAGFKGPAGSPGKPEVKPAEPASKLETQTKSEEILRRAAPPAPKSAAPPPALATSPLAPTAAPAPLQKDAGASDAAKSQSNLKKANAKSGDATKELRKSAETGPISGGGGGPSPGRGGDAKNIDKADSKPDERRPLGGGRGMNPSTIPPPGSPAPARSAGPPAAGEIQKARDDLAAAIRLDKPLIVREYAHRRTERTRFGVDFAETLYWHPVLVVPTMGADVAFDLADEVVGYRVIAAGHTLDGRVGSVTSRIDVRPLERKEADKARVPAKP